MTIYVLEQGTVLAKKDGRMIITKAKQVLDEIPLKKIERINLLGNITLTSQMINYCLDNKIEVIFMTQHGRYRGKLYTDEYRNVLLRLKQYERATDKQFQLEISKSIVQGKLQNYYNFLTQKSKNLPKGLLSEERAGIRTVIEKVNKAKTVDEVRGYEGIGSKIYFSGFKKCIRTEELTFNGRTAHPPKDEINAMLSLGYYFLYVEMLLAINAVGLDPYFGNLHTIDVSKQSLLFDLVEEFRCVIIDNFVLNLINLKTIKKEDFEKRENDIYYFTKDGMKKYITEYEQMMKQKLKYHLDSEENYIRTIFEKQARHYARVVLGDEEKYQPYYLEKI
ncbi:MULTISPECIES: CRISPR-associated endonuclease Cas1 [Fervidobacterium]|uniref:CRISPR-associated endonuclease Cas1 n=2 Tax=Fervidobacterium TaxID=2422 RepID=A7HNI6_FERNB|nr:MULTISPECIES: CRISPR-associated endonuclease Cas1 [Fervidobacterium]ABS61469.1 CRISPR-associated protein Cas1 [Fervidobacterium nodosum Rt17-B1]AMW33303.1 CRISPR-associated endonuclease Cas1 [Fervidobacterium islandicum]KAF2961082.1 CRISPR-associated protein Cas1 [Fervidobacterium sp. 2310opik-2]